MNHSFISKTVLFKGTSEDEVKSMLQCMKAYTKRFQKGEYIYRMDSLVKEIGLVLSGNVRIERDELWGDRSILSYLSAGQVFAEAYACAFNQPLMVNVISATDSEILFLNIDQIFSSCPTGCQFHGKLVKNLLSVMAQKNLSLSQKINDITPKSIRGRLMSYLTCQYAKKGTPDFEIPFNRQQLADYLCVDRSSMSNELSKMQREGLITFEKNRFSLNLNKLG